LLVGLISVFIVIALLQTVSAFEIEKKTITDVVTTEDTGIPATYSIIIEHGGYDTFRFYSILTIDIWPKEPIMVDTYSDKTVAVSMYPSQRMKERCGLGECSIQYFIKSGSGNAIEDNFEINVIPMSKIVSVNPPASIAHDSKTIAISIINNENINFDKVSVKVESDFVDFTKEFSLAPNTEATLDVALDSAKIQAAMAGEHNLKITFVFENNYSYAFEKKIQVNEFEHITTTESMKRSFFGYTTTVTKKNEGNKPTLVTIEEKQNRIESTFTGYSIDAAETQASGNEVVQKWQSQLQPGESLTVEMKTNYSMPVLLLGALIVGSTAFYIQRRPRVLIRKKAYKVRTKDGTPALKILLLVKNIGSEISDVRCTDFMPKMTELHERFGAAQPDVIDKNKMQWSFGSLMPDEEKAVSYIVYSKVAPLGMNFPRATVSYSDYKGKAHYSFSNNIAAFEA